MAHPPTGSPPPVLGRYRLGARLGSGGFGTVYAAVDERLDRDVAVKVIPDRLRRPPSARRARRSPPRGSTIRASSPCSTPARTARRATSSPSSCAGRTLDALASAGELSDRDVLRVGLALADALEHAHGRGVIHRDVKPQNVIVPDRPRSARSAAKLTDFGVAHLAGDAPLTRTGDVVGTLAYMAPEQADGHRVDERADLYSLALVLYEGLAGVNPVRAGSPAATARRLGTVLPPLGRKRKDLPPELCSALDRALSPRPEDRGSLDELADELAAGLTGVSDEGGTILAPSARAPAHRRAAARGRQDRRRRWPAAASRRRPPRSSPASRSRRSRRRERPRSRSPRCRGPAGSPARSRSPSCSRPTGRAPRSSCWPAPRAAAALVRGSGRAWSLPRGRAAARPGHARRRLPGRGGPRRALVAARGPRRAPDCGGCCWRSRCSARTLLSGADPPRGWEADAGRALDGVLWPPLASGLIALAAVWALAALVLPWLVRGRYAGHRLRRRLRMGRGAGLGHRRAGRVGGRRRRPAACRRGDRGGRAAWLLPRLLPRDIVDAPR